MSLIINPFIFAVGGGGPIGGSTATWNPADKSANVNLTNGDLTMDVASGTHSAVRGTSSASSGKLYYEVTIDNTSSNSGNCLVGVGKAAAGFSYVGSDADGWSWQYSSQLIWNNNSNSAYGSATGVVTDVIGILLDITGGTLEFSYQGALQGVAFSGLSGTFFPMISNRAGGQMTARFDSNTWAYFPSGYLEWT